MNKLRELYERWKLYLKHKSPTVLPINYLVSRRALPFITSKKFVLNGEAYQVDILRGTNRGHGIHSRTVCRVFRENDDGDYIPLFETQRNFHFATFTWGMINGVPYFLFTHLEFDGQAAVNLINLECRVYTPDETAPGKQQEFSARSFHQPRIRKNNGPSPSKLTVMSALGWDEHGIQRERTYDVSNPMQLPWPVVDE